MIPPALINAPRQSPPPFTPPWDEDRPGATFNIARYLPARAAERPAQRALVMPHGHDALGKRLYSHLTFGQLDALCDAYAHGLTRQGFKRGDRVIMMVKPGLDLIAVTYALFKIGAVPVMIDPGMGRKSFLACIAHSEPAGLIGIPLAHGVRKVFRAPFATIQRAVSTERRWWAGAPSLTEIADFAAGIFPCAPTDADELAAILFTSGSTGIPKGVHYSHSIFDGQVRAIGQLYGIKPGEIEVPAFPLFSLFSIALGMTCVIPDMDATRPAKTNPAFIVEAILDHGATTAFGSPAVWGPVARYCAEHKIKLPTLRRILTAGAPIPFKLLEDMTAMLPDDALIHTPYGATECLPVASISSREVLDDTAAKTREGAGICVGRPAHRMTIRIIAIDDAPIEQWSDATELPVGQTGEICVSGPVATRLYDKKPEHTALAKIPDPSLGPDGFWHRMGDVGYLDDQGRLWYCGRKSHRVETAGGTMFSVPCEAIAEEHPDVWRAALVGVGAPGQQEPVMLLDPHDPARAKDSAWSARLIDEVRALLAAKPHTAAIKRVLLYPGFPVDRRHNAKIHREELADWVAKLPPATR
jgi:acyl-CoA synthetase (AMP-forming)/AMP-acid ligase II